MCTWFARSLSSWAVCMMSISVQHCLDSPTQPFLTKLNSFLMNATHLSLRYRSSTFRSSSFCHFFRTGLTMSLNATWPLYSVFSVQIGTNRHNEKHSQDLWVFIEIFGYLFVMIDVKYGNTMNCFETLIKIEYSNVFFAAQSYVGTEVDSFFSHLWTIGMAKGAYWS